MNVDAVIVAAGSSTRFGGADKLSAELCGRPLLAWTLAAFEAATSIDRILVVTGEERLEAAGALGRAWAPRKFAGSVAGGARRRDSVEAGLRASEARYVAIHDGARPLITAELIDAVVARAEGRPGAILAVPVTDTVKEVGADGIITGHPARSVLWAAQTPQVVLRQAWLDCAEASAGDETDDAAMLARLGLDIAVVEGSHENLKVTRLEDLEIASAMLRRRGVLCSV